MKKTMMWVLVAVFTLVLPHQATAKSVEEIQVQDYAKTDQVIAAMKEFQAAFQSFNQENGIIAADKKEEVYAYWRDQFAKEYEKRNGGKKVENLRGLFDLLDDDSIGLQYHYIAANENPLGSKEKLERASDKSTWSNLHAKYHPDFRDYLNNFGLYDIFLIDLESGDLVYTVFKELDFSTSLLDGPFAQTNFGEVFRAVKDSSDKDFTISVEMKPYLPSYHDPARFIGAPVYDGDQKVGVLIMQLPAGM